MSGEKQVEEAAEGGVGIGNDVLSEEVGELGGGGIELIDELALGGGEGDFGEKVKGD